MTPYNYRQIGAHDEAHDELKNHHEPSLDIELVGMTRRKMLLIVICLTKAILKIRTYPDFGVRITGLLMGRCLYIHR